MAKKLLINITRNGQHWQTVEMDDPRVEYVRTYNEMAAQGCSAVIVRDNVDELKDTISRSRYLNIPLAVILSVIVSAAVTTASCMWLSQDTWTERQFERSVFHERLPRYAALTGNWDAVNKRIIKNPAGSIYYGTVANGKMTGDWMAIMSDDEMVRRNLVNRRNNIYNIAICMDGTQHDTLASRIISPSDEMIPIIKDWIDGKSDHLIPEHSSGAYELSEVEEEKFRLYQSANREYFKTVEKQKGQLNDGRKDSLGSDSHSGFDIIEF